jgi:hypothetical protein
MTVLFGGVAAENVEVVSGVLAYCVTPEGDPDGLKVVVVQNLDAAGDPVVGETASLADAYTFVRPDINVESELARVVRALILWLKRVAPRAGSKETTVAFTTSVDYAEDGTGDVLNYAANVRAPALILANLDVPEDRKRPAPEPVRVTLPGGRFAERRPPLICDVNMTLVGVVDGPGAPILVLNFMQVVRMAFQKKNVLRVDRDADDSSAGYVEYDLYFSFAAGVAVSHAGENADVESFAGQVRVEGVMLEDAPGLPGGPAVVDGLSHEATQRVGWVAGEDSVVVTPEGIG